MNQQPATSNQQPAADAVRQCGSCLRLHDGQRNIRPPKLVLDAFTESCGREDCEAVRRAIWEEQRVRTEAMKKKAWQPIYDRRAARRENCEDRKTARGDGGSATGNRPTGRDGGHRPAATGARMPYADDDREFQNPAAAERQLRPTDLPHRERQAAFVASGAAESDNERMLELLWRDFIPEDKERRSRGVWISTQELIHRHKINTPHSRASQLRGSETLVPHPLVVKWRLDIDQCSDPAVTGQTGSCYSVCFVERSERLRRERARRRKIKRILHDALNYFKAT